ncbi:MAG: hypothetical protein WAV40_00155 [Microgenomates group bacterium]
MTKKLAVFALITLTLCVAATSLPPSAFASWLIDRSGTLIKLDPRILGDDDVSKVEENKTESKSAEQKTESSKSEDKSEKTENKEQEKAAEQAKEASEKAKHELEKKIEINAVRAKTQKTEKESEVEVEGNKLKIKQKTKDARGKETETEMQLEDGEELQVESKTGDDSQKFSLKARLNDGIEVEKDGVTIHTNLPISISPDNELVVTHPDGTTRVVAIMPDQALKMLRDQNITPSDDSLDLPELEQEDGESVYKVDATKAEKVLGIFKVSYKTKATVSAETGEIIKTELSGLDRFLSLFSF